MSYNFKQFLEDESLRIRKNGNLRRLSVDKGISHSAVYRFSKGASIKTDTMLSLMEKGVMRDPFTDKLYNVKAAKELKKEIRKDLIKKFTPTISKKISNGLDEKLKKQIINTLEMYQTNNNKASELIGILEK